MDSKSPQDLTAKLFDKGKGKIPLSKSPIEITLHGNAKSDYYDIGCAKINNHVITTNRMKNVFKHT